MLSLRKIKELNGFRFFQNYKWDENDCKLFNQNNIIYGWNGSGKTTLCDFFKELETGTISGEEATFTLMFEDSDSGQMKNITQKSVGSLHYAFRVFHQDYIQENIRQDNVKHIFTVGKEQAEKINEIKKIRAEATLQEASVKRLSSEYSELFEDIDRFKTQKAKIIKEASNYSSSYNKNKYYAAHQALSDKKILSDTEYQKVLAAIRENPLGILQFSFSSFIQPTVKDYICNILNQTPVNNTIDALAKDAVASKWVEQGLELHDNKRSTVCLFCGNKISNERLNALRNHFNRSYRELSDKIDKAIELLNEKERQFDSAKQSLPNWGLLYKEFQQEYQNRFEKAVELCDKYILIIHGIVDILKKKKSDMINETLTDQFTTLISQLSFDYTIFDEISKIIEEHNKKTQEFQESIQKAQKAVELHHVSSYADELTSLEEKISKKTC